MMEALGPPTRRFSQEPHCATSQNGAFFIVTAVETLNLRILSFDPGTPGFLLLV
jgi:hypothetical protein